MTTETMPLFPEVVVDEGRVEGNKLASRADADIKSYWETIIHNLAGMRLPSLPNFLSTAKKYGIIAAADAVYAVYGNYKTPWAYPDIDIQEVYATLESGGQVMAPEEEIAPEPMNLEGLFVPFEQALAQVSGDAANIAKIYQATGSNLTMYGLESKLPTWRDFWDAAAQYGPTYVASKVYEESGYNAKVGRGISPVETPDYLGEPGTIIYPFLTLSEVLTAEQAKAKGIEIPENWHVRLTPDTSKRGFSVMLIAPDRSELSEDQIVEDEAGVWLTPQEAQKRKAALDHMATTFGAVFPEKELQEVLTWANDSPDEFLEAIVDVGYNPQTDALLHYLFPTITDQDIEQLFFPQANYQPVEPGISMPPSLVIGALSNPIKSVDVLPLPTPGALAEIEQRKAIEEILSKFSPVFAPEEMYSAIQLASSNPDLFLENLAKRPQDENTLELANWLKGPQEKPKSEPQKLWDGLGKMLNPQLGDDSGTGSQQVQGFMEVLGVAGSFMDKYLGRPWETLIVEFMSATDDALLRTMTMEGPPPEPEKGSPSDVAAGKLAEVRKKVGFWSSLIAEDVSDIWNQYCAESGNHAITLKIAAELNPVYFIPIGGTIGLGARFTSRIPVIGRLAERIAAGVRVVEEAAVAPVTIPAENVAEFTTKKLYEIGESLGERAVNVVNESAHIMTLANLPKTEKLIAEALQENWLKTVLQTAARIKPVKAGIEAGLGKRILVETEIRKTEDVAGQAAIIISEFQRMGLNAQQVQVQVLRSIISDPVKCFGFDAAAFSETMAKRIRPGVEVTAEVGTLEHVFTKPELYNWIGLEEGLQYVTHFNDINNRVLGLLQIEGVAPEYLLEDWMHRVVVGKVAAEGAIPARLPPRGGTAIGARMPFEKERRFGSMAEGVAFGTMYAVNPEVSIAAYIQEAFKKIGDKRFELFVGENLQRLGFGAIKPSQRLFEMYPEAVQRAVLTTEKYHDANMFKDVINRALRGEIPPTQTLDAIEARFPELGSKFRQLIQNAPQVEGLENVIAWNREIIANLQNELKIMRGEMPRGPRPEIPVEVLRPIDIPDQVKLTEALRTLDYEDRQVIREVMHNQYQDVGRIISEQEGEIGYIREFLNSDPVANYRGRLTQQRTAGTASFMPTTGKQKLRKGRQVSLLSFLTPEGDWPQTITLNQAKILRFGKDPRPSSIIIVNGKKRVKWEYVIDEMADSFGLTPDELIERLKYIKQQQSKLDDLVRFQSIADDRLKSIDRIVKALDSIDLKPEQIARAVKEPVYAKPFNFEEPGVNPKGIKTMITADDEAKLRALKWTDDEIRFMTPEEAQGIIERSEARFTVEAEEEVLSIPKAEEGMPEAGLQSDMFGYQAPVYPTGKAKFTQMSMDEVIKMAEWNKTAGVEAPAMAVKPQIEGVPELADVGKSWRIEFEAPDLTAPTRKQELKALRDEIAGLAGATKLPFQEARAERARLMKMLRQPEIGEGYIMQPFAAGKIYDQSFIDAFNKFFGREAGLPGLTVIGDMSGIMRVTKASLDFSAMTIQGLPSFGLAAAYMLQNPKIGTKLMGAWFKAYSASIRAFFDPSILPRYLAKNEATALQRVVAGGSVKAGDYINFMVAKSGIGKAAEEFMAKIPGNPYARAEMSFFTGTEIVRDEFWKLLSPAYIEARQEGQLARILDRLTGITDSKALGVPLSIRQVETAFGWFAPNYTRACLTILADMFRGGMTGAVARKAIGGMLAAGALMYSTVQFAISSLQGKDWEDAMRDVMAGFCIEQDPITGDWTWNPSASFMTLKVGNYNMGVGGFWYGLMRLGGNVMDVVQQNGDRELVDFVKLIKDGRPNMNNPFLYWWYTRSAPSAGLAFDLASGRDFLGYPFEGAGDYAQYILTRFEPIWMEQGINWLIPGFAKKNEIPQGLAKFALAPTELFGYRTFPESAWANFYAEADKLAGMIPEDMLDPRQKAAYNAGRLGWQQLTDLQKSYLKSQYQNLNGLWEEAQRDSQIRNSPAWQQWQTQTTAEKKAYYKRGTDLINKFNRGEITTKELREEWGEAGQNYGTAMETIAKVPAYKPIYDFFDERAAEGTKYNFDDDRMKGLYVAVVYADYLTDEGDFDWDARDMAIDNLIADIGEENYIRIRDSFSADKLLEGCPPLMIELANDKSKLSEYYKMPYETKEDRDAKLEYRRNNPEVDAILNLWGYNSNVLTKAAYDILIKRAGQLGMSLAGVEGLPPVAISEDYFEYQDLLATGASSNSAAVKLFKIEHPRFYTWGADSGRFTGTLETDESTVAALKIKVKWEKEEAEYADLITEEEGEAYLEAHPEYADDRIRIKGYEAGLPKAQIETYLEYNKLPEAGYERKWFLQEHDEFHTAMVEAGVWQFKQNLSAVPDEETYRTWELFAEEWRDLDKADYNGDWWLMEHKDWYDAAVALGKMSEQDFSKVPTEKVWKLYQEYQELPLGEERKEFRRQHADLDKWMVLTKKVTGPVGTPVPTPSPTIPKPTKTPIPEDIAAWDAEYKALPLGTARVEFRREHPEYNEWGMTEYGWSALATPKPSPTPTEAPGPKPSTTPKPPKPTPTPLPEDIAAWDAEYKKLPYGTARYEYRYNHPEYNAWGMEQYGWAELAWTPPTPTPTKRPTPTPVPEKIQKWDQDYHSLSTAKERLQFRCEHAEFEAWGEQEYGWTPLGDRCKK